MSLPSFGAAPLMKNEYQMVPEGTHLARVFRVVDLGDHMNDWGTLVKNIHITFELVDVMMDYYDKETKQKVKVPMTIANRFGYDYKMTKRAKLRLHAESIMNKKFTEDEASQFNPLYLINKMCMVEVFHKPSNDGTRVYENIKNVIAAPVGTEVRKGYQKPCYYMPSHPQMFPKLPEWMQKKIGESQAAPQFPDVEDGFPDVDQRTPAELEAEANRQAAQQQASDEFTPPGVKFGGVEGGGHEFDDDVPF